MIRYLLLLSLLFSLPVLALTTVDELSPRAPASISEPDTGALRTALTPVLAHFSARASEPQPIAVPDLSLEELGRLVVQAITGRSWSLLASLLLVGLVLLARKLGGKVLPWLDTARGALFLSVVGGTATLLSVALGQGQPFTLGLLVSCLMGAASAAGLWSWGQTAARGGTPRVAPMCTPEEVANGTCRPS